MKFFIFICLLSLLNISFAENIRLNPKKWKLLTVGNNFNAFGQSIPNLGLIAFKTEAIVNSNLEKLITVLRDAKGGMKWSENLLHLEYINEKSDLEATVYEVRNFPWPLNDRDGVVHYKATINHQRKSIYVTFNSVDHEKYPKNDNYVRGTLHYGLMEFWPRKDGTKIELTILAAPNGNIPNWVVNTFQKSFPARYVKQLQEETIISKREVRPGIKKLVQEYLNLYPPADYKLSINH